MRTPTTVRRKMVWPSAYKKYDDAFPITFQINNVNNAISYCVFGLELACKSLWLHGEFPAHLSTPGYLVTTVQLCVYMSIYYHDLEWLVYSMD
jgi:hypothetical protein